MDGPMMANKRSDDRVAELAAAVTLRRKELGLLQAELANLAGCSERFVHTVEHGKQTVRLDKLLDVLEVLGLGLVVAPGAGSVTVPEERGEGEEA
ncbi:MAG TPA: type II toxin-antitoxin system Y4mF family antitoxin [Longimicrobiales bacterium]|nr:type II toxin-antitoxin system Y4mF family antitoxin [Longimicrobiales bacterium]